MTHPNSLKNLKMWQPGQSGYAGIRVGSKLPAELRAINSLTQLETTKLISKYARMNYGEISLLLEKKTIPILELAFCSIFKESVDKGDFTRLAFLLDRSIGKVPQIIEDDEDSEERERLKKMTLQELLIVAQTKLQEAS